ncbi:MAG: hypothetical protein Q7S44_01000, partial [bacterium]|nr:hypothetical protein [bacterium]
IALIFLILLLSIFLGITGVQVFFILRDFKKSVDKIDLLLGNAQNLAENIQRPIKAAAELGQMVEQGVQAAKVLSERIINNRKEKPQKKIFKTNSR